MLLNLALDVKAFFNILLLGDLIFHVWRSDRRCRGVAVVWSVKGDRLRLLLSISPVEKYYNQITRVISGSTCDAGAEHQSKELLHARIVLSERCICHADARLHKSDCRCSQSLAPSPYSTTFHEAEAPRAGFQHANERVRVSL